MERDTIIMAAVAAEIVWPGREDLGHDDVRAEIMFRADLVMAGVTYDSRTGGHIVPGGSNRLTIVAGQDIAYRCGMASGTGSIRCRNRGMDIVPLSRKDSMANAAVLLLKKIILSKGQIHSVTILVNAIVGNFDSTGIDTENVVVAVISSFTTRADGVIAIPVSVYTRRTFINLAVAVVINAITNFYGAGIDSQVIIVAVISTACTRTN
jgi:hypothetical protein